MVIKTAATVEILVYYEELDLNFPSHEKNNDFCCCFFQIHKHLLFLSLQQKMTYEHLGVSVLATHDILYVSQIKL